MKLKNGKIGNINKKLLAGALALTFTATSLVSCASNINIATYKTNESGYIVGFNGFLNKSYMYSCSFVKVKNTIKNVEYYTIAYTETIKGRTAVVEDIFTKQDLKSNVFEIEIVSNFKDYLIAYNMVKNEYTEEELREILNIFIQNLEKENTKQKVME